VRQISERDLGELIVGDLLMIRWSPMSTHLTLVMFMGIDVELKPTWVFLDVLYLAYAQVPYRFSVDMLAALKRIGGNLLLLASIGDAYG
jgi:hypothetical protein